MSRGDSLYLVSDTGLTVLDAESGTLLSESRFVNGRDETLITSYSIDSDDSDNDKSPLFGTIRKAALSDDGKYLLFTSKGKDYQESLKDYLSILYAHDPETGKTVQIDTVPYGKECFNTASYCTKEAPDMEHVLYTKLIEKETGYAIVLTSVVLEYEESSLSFRQEWECEIPLTQQTRNSKVSGGEVFGSELAINTLYRPRSPEEPASILFACDEDLLLINPEDGRILYDQPLSGKILKIRPEQHHCFLYSGSGKIYDCIGKELQLYAAAFEDHLNDIEKLGDEPSFYCLGSSNRITHYSPDEPDPDFVKLGSDHYSLDDPEILYQGGDLILLDKYYALCLINEKEDTVRFITHSELIQSAHREEGGDGADTADRSYLSLSNKNVLYAQDGIVHLLIESVDSSHNSVLTHYQLSAADGIVSAEDLLQVNKPIYMSNDVLYDPDRHLLYIMYSSRDDAVIWTYSFDTSKAARHVVPLGGEYSFCCLSPEGDKILLYSRKSVLLVLNTNTWQTEYTISGTSYSEALAKSISIYSTWICWDGHTLIVPDKHKLHVYDDAGTEIHTISCEYGTDDGIYEGIPCAALSPSGRCLYYFLNSTLVQYSLTDDKILNEITLPTDRSGSTRFRTVCFDPVRERTLDRLRITFPFPESDVPEPDIMHIVSDGVYYCVRCDSEAFGVMTMVNDAFAYSPASGKIYLSIRNYTDDYSDYLYDYLYYKEYSIPEIIEIARDRYSDL